MSASAAMRMAVRVSAMLSMMLLGLHGASAESRSSLTDGLIRYVMRDYVRAREILAPLAHDGNADAQLQLGRMYANGEGGAVDAGEAAHWYRRAAEQGKAEAQFALGMMYASGEGVAPDDALALHWLRQAADQNAPHALNAVGELLLRAESPQTRAEARAWFLRAARLDNARALYHLGQLYAFGSGVPQDDIEACKWFNLAASAGLGAERDAATRALITLRERMTPIQVARATVSAQSWFRTQIAASRVPTFAEGETP
jgi:TPR repeat protein